MIMKARKVLKRLSKKNSFRCPLNVMVPVKYPGSPEKWPF